MNDKIDVNLMNKTVIDSQENYDIKVWFFLWFFESGNYDNLINDIEINVEKTSLYRAIEIGNIEIVNLLLLNNRIDVNIKNKFHKFLRECSDGQTYVHLERTALNLAIINENIEIVKLLLINDSIDINLSNYDMCYGNSCDDAGSILRKAAPLVFAIEKDNIEIVKILLMNNKINVNAKFAFGDMLYSDYDKYKEYTPLHFAIKQKNIDIVDLLLMNKKLDLNSSSINYKCDDESDDYKNYSFFLFGTRREFTKTYEQPCMKRFILKSEKKNRDLLKKFVLENNIDLSTHIKKLLE